MNIDMVDIIETREYVYPNGQLQFQLPYLNGLAHGIHRSWNENGFLDSEHRYTNGLLNGLCITYFNGNLWCVFTCFKDLQEGESIDYEY